MCSFPIFRIVSDRTEENGSNNSILKVALSKSIFVAERKNGKQGKRARTICPTVDDAAAAVIAYLTKCLK